MFTISPTGKTMNKLMRTISDDVCDNMLEQLNDCDRERVQNIFENAVTKTIQQQEKPKKTTKKPRIPIPFYGCVLDDKCEGIKKNHNLYTQCMNNKTNGKYCSVCSKQANNSANKKPIYGNIYERQQCWNDKLEWAPEGKTKEVPYMNVVKKMGIDISQAQQIVKDLGWEPIPKCHLIERKVRRGRPKVKNVAVDDSDDEEKPKRSRGRPVGTFKKKEKKKEPTDEELIALLCGQ